MNESTPPPGGTGREQQGTGGPVEHPVDVRREQADNPRGARPDYGYGDTDAYGGYANANSGTGNVATPPTQSLPAGQSAQAVKAPQHAQQPAEAAYAHGQHAHQPQGAGHAPGHSAPHAAAPHLTSGPGIRAENVSRAFGQVQAVLDLSFEAPRGAVTALVGPNGCGKSTLMLMLASLLAPDSGRVLIGGIDPTKNSPAVRRAVGWMPDQFGAWDSLRVAEVLEVMGRAYFLPTEQVRARTMELLDLMDLHTLAQQPAHVLSRGQKQRLGLARAMVHSPQVLILDEPASGLDPASRRRLLRVVRQAASDGTTVLVSSHILSELEEMADHVVFMDAGRVVDASSIRALAARPRPWKVESLDQEALQRALRTLGVRHSDVTSPENAASGHAETTVQLPDEATAARLLADLTGQDARIVAFGPATGRLEAAYLSSAAAQRQGAL